MTEDGVTSNNDASRNDFQESDFAELAPHADELGFRRAYGIALEALALRRAGYIVEQLPVPGKKWLIRSEPRGPQITLAEIRRYTRRVQQGDARCTTCGTELAVVAGPHRKRVRGKGFETWVSVRPKRGRGLRLDREYCSNVCRQRAYRTRSKSDRTG